MKRLLYIVITCYFAFSLVSCNKLIEIEKTPGNTQKEKNELNQGKDVEDKAQADDIFPIIEINSTRIEIQTEMEVKSLVSAFDDGESIYYIGKSNKNGYLSSIIKECKESKNISVIAESENQILSFQFYCEGNNKYIVTRFLVDFSPLMGIIDLNTNKTSLFYDFIGDEINKIHTYDEWGSYECIIDNYGLVFYTFEIGHLCLYLYYDGEIELISDKCYNVISKEALLFSDTKCNFYWYDLISRKSHQICRAILPIENKNYLCSLITYDDNTVYFELNDELISYNLKHNSTSIICKSVVGQIVPNHYGYYVKQTFNNDTTNFDFYNCKTGTHEFSLSWDKSIPDWGARYLVKIEDTVYYTSYENETVSFTAN